MFVLAFLLLHNIPFLDFCIMLIWVDLVNKHHVLMVVDLFISRVLNVVLNQYIMEQELNFFNFLLNAIMNRNHYILNPQYNLMELLKYNFQHPKLLFFLFLHLLFINAIYMKHLIYCLQYHLPMDWNLLHFQSDAC